MAHSLALPWKENVLWIDSVVRLIFVLQLRSGESPSKHPHLEHKPASATSLAKEFATLLAPRSNPQFWPNPSGWEHHFQDAGKDNFCVALEQGALV